MLRRIFIALNLPEQTKKELFALKERWPELPARWTKPENIHLTLVFLGNTADRELKEVRKLMDGVGERHAPFSLTLEEVSYGPSPSNPRMVWAKLSESDNLRALQEDTEKTLGNSQQLSYIPEKRDFTSHLTLARLREWEFKKMPPEERPDIEETLSISFLVESIDIMESKLKRGGAEYTLAARFLLRKV